MGKRICQFLHLVDAIKDLLYFMLAVRDVESAMFREEKCTLCDTIHLHECRQLLLDVVIHTQVSADSTDYICSVMYNLYNGLQRALNMINWNGVVSTMSDVLNPNSVSPWAVSQCHPATSWDEYGPELWWSCRMLCTATRAELQQGWRERGAQKRR